MSISADELDGATFRDGMARIDRQQAETRKVAAEQTKLAAQASKPRSDRSIGPVAKVASIIGACGGVVAADAGLGRLTHRVFGRSAQQPTQSWRVQ